MSGKITITPYGGLGEIGMNCMLIESDSTAILIDCGLMFSELDSFGVQFIIPNFTHLLAKKDKIKAIFATHGHEDHIGALPFAIKAGLRAPIYSSQFTSLMIRERMKDSGLEDAVKLNVLAPGAFVDVGDLRVTTASVNHSIIDAFALFIDTPIGKIIHTGDFKLDASPHFGDIFAHTAFKKAGDEGVLLLLSDSTNVEREDHALLDTTIKENMEELFSKAEGMILVSMFSSNVGRMANIFSIAKKLGRKIVLTGRSMEQNMRLAHERGAVDLDSAGLVPLDQMNQHDRKKLLVLSTGCQGEPRSALNRVAHGEHNYISIGAGDLVVFSSSQIPGNEVSISKIINQLFRSGADVLYDAVADVHTSGHATKPELKKMIEMVRPKFFIPVHGEYRHLVHHAKLAVDTGVIEDNVAVVQNGEVVELTKDGLKFVGLIDELRIMVDGREGTEITRDVLRDRRRMGEMGVVFCMMARERETGRILTKPEVIGKGLINASFEPWLLEEATKIVEKIIIRYKEDLKDGPLKYDLSEEVRVELRRFFDRNIGKKPTVVPIILDV
jgi:ribonuclease J